MEKFTLPAEELAFFRLRSLFENNGYRRYRMRKFEEYALYLNNKSLKGNSFITFLDPNGRLLALKPDVTLSIAKQTTATKQEGEKLYYKESVFRFDKSSNEFREVSQIGVENLGKIGKKETLEIVELALNSLKQISADYILDVSDMGIFAAIKKEYLLSDDSTEEIFKAIRAKSIDAILILCKKYSISGEKKELLKLMASPMAEYNLVLQKAGEVLTSKEAIVALESLIDLKNSFDKGGFKGKLKIDFSIVNDVDYYNGIIFQGYVNSVPKPVLFGGRYDRLVADFKKEINAAGFALYLDGLKNLWEDEGEEFILTAKEVKKC